MIKMIAQFRESKLHPLLALKRERKLNGQFASSRDSYVLTCSDHRPEALGHDCGGLVACLGRRSLTLREMADRFLSAGTVGTLDCLAGLCVPAGVDSAFRAGVVL